LDRIAGVHDGADGILKPNVEGLSVEGEDFQTSRRKASESKNF
jgi:hypothetical protein